MKQKLTDPEKFDPIIESFINGNKTWVTAQVKKLSRNERKLLYRYSEGQLTDPNDQNFFFKLI